MAMFAAPAFNEAEWLQKWAIPPATILFLYGALFFFPTYRVEMPEDEIRSRQYIGIGSWVLVEITKKVRWDRAYGTLHVPFPFNTTEIKGYRDRNGKTTTNGVLILLGMTGRKEALRYAYQKLPEKAICDDFRRAVEKIEERSASKRRIA